MIKVNGTELTQGKYPDGSLMCHPPFIGGGSICIEWHYENDGEFFTIQCLRNHYFHQWVELQMLYCPHARMDRVKNNSDMFTLQAFAKVINAMKFDKVIILDAHSNVAPALIDRCENINATPMILKAIEDLAKEKEEDNLALFFPDEGAMKRYTDYFYHIPFSFGVKKRNWDTGAILSLNIQDSENIKGKDVLIIDDICSKGTTFYYSAKALLEAGAKSVSLYITHCENTILEGQIFESKLIERVYTTDSLVHKDELKEKVIYV